MNKRQREVIQSQLKSEESVLKDLRVTYKKALDEIDEKIASLLGREDTENLQSIIYQVDYQKALRQQINGILDTMNSEQFTTISDYLAKCYEDGFLGTLYDLQGQGIPLVLPIDQKQVVQAVQHDTKLSESLYETLGENTTELKKSIRTNLSRGIATGSSYESISRVITSTMVGDYRKMRGGALAKAYTITRTEGHRIQNQAADDMRREAVAHGADIVKQWDSTLDKRTRPSHQRVDGELRELDEKFSNGLLYPGDPNGKAAEVVNCRCACLQRAKWALDEDELQTLKDRAEYYGLDKTENFDDFKQKYLDASKDAIYNDNTINNTIKSIDVDDFESFASDYGLQEDVRNTIINTLTRFEYNGSMYISEAHFGEFYDDATGKQALFQVFVGNDGLCHLNVNSKIMGGKTLEEINRKISDTHINLPNTLEEAVVHECGHAKAYFGKSAKEISEMNKLLENKGVPGISTIAELDGAECIAEVEVLLFRGESVPEEAMKLYNEFVGRKKK